MKTGWILGAAFLSLAIVLVAFLAAMDDATVERLSARETLDGIDVPAIGTVGDFPDPAHRIVVNVTADGTIVVDGSRIAWDELPGELRRRAARSESPLAGSRAFLSDESVVLREDGLIPFGATKLLVSACAEARLWRIFLGVRHETSGGEGAVAIFLPHDVGTVCAGDDTLVRRRARLRAGGGASSPAALYREIQRSPAALTGKLGITIDADSRAPTSAVVALLDAALRGGARAVEFAAGEPAVWADAVRPTPGTVAFVVDYDGKPLPADPAPPMPAVARITGALAGSSDPMSDVEEPPEIVERKR